MNEKVECQWQGDFAALARHENTECEFAKATCDYCNDSITKCLMSAHVLKCKDEKIRCKECGDELKRKKMKRHLKNECLMTMTKCRECSVPYIRIHESQHQQVCPRAIVTCRYARVGCNHTGMRQSMESHYDCSTARHLELTFDSLMQAHVMLSNMETSMHKMKQDMKHLNAFNKTLVRMMEKHSDAPQTDTEPPQSDTEMGGDAILQDASCRNDRHVAQESMLLDEDAPQTC